VFSKRIRGLFLIGGILLAIAVIYFPSFSKYQELKRSEKELSLEVKRLSEILNKLHEEESLLAGDKEYLEKIARNDLGRAAPGETVYRMRAAREDDAEKAFSQ